VNSTNIISEINTKQNIINDDTLTISKTLNLQSSLNTLQDNINLKQNIINDDDLTISKTLNLQSLLNNLQDNINLNTVNILTKQPTITTATSLLLDILTTKNLYVGENTGDSTTKSIFFGGTNGDNNYILTVIENRIYEETEKAELLLFKGNDLEGNSGADRIRLRAANIVFDTYPIASTNRTAESIRMTILSNGNVGIGTTTPTSLLNVNGNVLEAGDLIAENLIIGSSNVLTELTSLDSRLDTEEPKTTALQTLTAIHTTDILTKQDLITSSTDLECNSLIASSAIINSLDIVSGFTSLQTQVDALIEYITNVGFLVVRQTNDLISTGNKLGYNVITFDTENGYNTTDFTYTIALAGTYLFTLQVFVPNGVEMTVDLIRKRAGVETIIQQITNGTNTGSNNSSYSLTTISEVLVGDLIFGYVSLGSVRLNLVNGTTQYASFSGSRISN